MPAFDHGKLVDREPVVGGRVGTIDELHVVAGDRAVRPLVLDRDAVSQHPMESTVVPQQRSRIRPPNLKEGLLPRLLGDLRVELPDRLAQPPLEHDVAKGHPLRRRLARSDVRAMRNCIAKLPEPTEGHGFYVGFIEFHDIDSMTEETLSSPLSSLGSSVSRRVARVRDS